MDPDAPTIDPDTLTLTGTDGDDQVVQGDVEEPDFVTAYLGDGNDTIGMPRGSSVFGEGGDDVITVVGRNAIATQIDGGEGDDLITADAIIGTVTGGEGNDTINHSELNMSDDGSYSLDGGAGDDVINAVFRVGRNIQDVNITGGDGADQFNLGLDLGGMTLQADYAPPLDGLSAATIMDFDPTQDQLTIDVGTGVHDVRLEDGTTAPYGSV